MLMIMKGKVRLAWFLGAMKTQWSYTCYHAACRPWSGLFRDTDVAGAEVDARDGSGVASEEEEQRRERESRESAQRAQQEQEQERAA